MNLFLRIIFIVESLFISVILGNVLISHSGDFCKMTSNAIRCFQRI